MNGSTTTEERARTLLSDLGRATLRGIRKCRQCGVYSGSRGATCKNKTCNAVFKDKKSSSKNNSDRRAKLSQDSACRLLVDANLQAHIYSVRVRDRGPDHRAFVQFPHFINNNNNDNNNHHSVIINEDGADSNGSIDNGSPLPLNKSVDGINAAGLCFVDNCDKSFKNNNVTQCHVSSF